MISAEVLLRAVTIFRIEGHYEKAGGVERGDFFPVVSRLRCKKAKRPM